MKTTAAAILFLGVICPILAQDVDRDDFPSQCDSVCVNIAEVSDQCDRQFRNDREETDCMCQAANAEDVIPLCAACAAYYDNDDDDDRNDGDDNDVGDVRRSCGFASATYDPASSYTVGQMTAATSLTSGSNASPTPTGNNQASQSLNSLSSQIATATNTDQLNSAINSISSSVASQASAAATADSGAAGYNNAQAQAALAGAGLLAAAAWL